MSEPNHRNNKITRRDVLKKVAGAAAIGAAGLAVPSAIAQQSGSNEKIDVIIAKTRPVDSPGCSVRFPPLNPGVRVEDGMRIERDIAVKMRDGVNIYIDIYRPDGATNVPAIVAYASGKKPEDRVRRGVPHHGGSDWGLYDASDYAMGEGPDPAYWCKYGYAMVNTDYRGAGHSGGVGQLFGTQGGRDVHDLVEWLATQDWSNGKIGMAGNSQLATWQWVGAAEEPPHLAAIAPWEGWTDLYRQIVCPGGIPEIGVRSGAIKNWCGGDGVEDDIAMVHKYPFMNSYWEDKIARLDKIKVPAYITANFKHWHLLGALNAFRQIPGRNKWLRFINNQEWPDFYTIPHMDDLRSFFDRYLKGIDNEWETTPRVRLCVLDPGGLDQINRPEKEWPLARTRYEKLYLDASSETLSRQPVQKESQARYDSQTGQANFLVKFDRDTELTGYFKLRLWVEADDANDMDLFIYVQKLDHKGTFLPSYILGHMHPGAQGWLRVSHRELDPKRSTPEEPYLTHMHQQLIRPKEIVPVEIPIWPMGMLWHAGQQLRVIVSGHYIDTRGPEWWEKFHYEAQNHGDHIIHTGGKYDSNLLIPHIPV